MKKILVVGGMVKGGGISQFLMNTYSTISSSKDLQIDFVNEIGKNDYKDEMKQNGWNVYYISPIKKNILKYFFDWYVLLKNKAKDYDVVHFHYDSLVKFFPLLLAKFLKTKKVIMHSHNSNSETNNYIKKNAHKIGKIITAKYASDFFACSSKAADWFFTPELLSKGKVKIIKNGIRLDTFKFSSQVRENIREELNFEEKFVIGHVGRFEAQKNHQFVIKVFHEINKKNKNTVLLLIGDGSKKKEIVEMVNELDLTDSVKFLGLRKDIPNLLQAMDVLLFPSLYEGLPLTLVEAQTSGLSCFVSDSIASETKCSEFVSFLSLEDKPEKWAYEILKEENNNSRNRCNGYFQVKKSGYDIKDVADDLTDFYLRINE